MMNTLKRLLVEDEGQGMAEYGLILAGVAIVAMVAIKALGVELGTLFTSITALL